LATDPPPSVRHDSGRLAELRRLAVLDTAPERAYDEITRLLATTLAVPITMVNLLDAERDWFKSRVGVQQTQSARVTSFCEAFFNTSDQVVAVEDTLHDTRFAGHPMVIGRPFIRFYAAARLVVRGQTVGTLCAYDTQPRAIAAEQLEHLRLMAGAVVELLGQRVAVAEG
jgi:GAF domain-containing protein